MNIVISCHFDLAKPVMYMKIEDGELKGIVDNFAGVFASYKAARATKTTVYLTNYEEKPGYKGAATVASELGKKDTFVLVVDTCTDAEDKEAYIGNAYNVNYELLKKKFGNRIYFKDGLYEEDLDETYIYGHENGFRTMFFGIPIPKDYHDTDNKVKLKTIDVAAKVLEEILVWISSHSEFFNLH